MVARRRNSPSEALHSCFSNEAAGEMLGRVAHGTPPPSMPGLVPTSHPGLHTGLVGAPPPPPGLEDALKPGYERGNSKDDEKNYEKSPKVSTHSFCLTI